MDRSKRLDTLHDWIQRDFNEPSKKEVPAVVADGSTIDPSKYKLALTDRMEPLISERSTV